MRRALLCVALSLIASALPVNAQETAEPKSPFPARNAELLAQARALVSSGDSASAVKLLQEATAKFPNDAPLWYEYGALLSERTRFAWRRKIMPAGIPRLIIVAESSLARAMLLAPDSVTYVIRYGKHLLGTNSTSNAHSSRVQKRAMNAAGADDSLSRGETADQVGTMMWRRFEAMIGRSPPSWASSSSSDFMNSQTMAQFLKETFIKPSRMYGLGLYLEAIEYYRKARMSNRDNEAYFRHEMMALAEGARWPEMAAIARERLRERPQQPWPWLVLGLSEHRQGRFAAAQIAFDSGFAKLPSIDRNRLESIAMLLPTKRQPWYDSLSIDTKRQLQELFWNTSNPSLLLSTNLLQSEFRARMVFAELRWTDDETPVQGTTTQKGNVYARFGPPDAVFQTGLTAGGYLNTWYYIRDMKAFTFNQNMLFGTAYLTVDSRTALDSIGDTQNASWTNLPVLRHRIDSVSAQVARFRATNDSIDVAVFTGIRTGSLRREAPFESSIIRHGLFFVDALGRELSRETGSFESSERDTLVMAPQNYFLRTSSAAKVARIEALEPDLMQAARSITDLSGFTTRGFDLSDLLVVASIKVPEKATARWNDYELAPLTGSLVRRGSPLALIWETYEPGEAEGKGHVRFSVAVQREAESGLVAVAGKVVGGIREALTGRSTQEQVTISYDRTFATSSVLVDHLIVNLGRLEPGRYRVSLTATDVVTSKSATRSQRFVITP